MGQHINGTATNPATIASVMSEIISEEWSCHIQLGLAPVYTNTPTVATYP